MDRRGWRASGEPQPKPTLAPKTWKLFEELDRRSTTGGPNYLQFEFALLEVCHPRAQEHFRRLRNHMEARYELESLDFIFE